MNDITSMSVARLKADGESQSIPHSIEAEQQLLGAILNNNDCFDSVTQIINENHFYDPVHARIFEVMASRLKMNALANQFTLKVFLENDEGLKALGGPNYLVRLVAGAVSMFAVRDYAQMIYDLFVRRELMNLGQEISDKAARVDVSSEPREQIVEAEQRLYQLGEDGRKGSEFVSLLNASLKAITIAGDAHKRDSKFAGLSTGLIDLDRRLGGLQKSDLVILAGRPSMGKTSLATNIAFNVAKSYQRGQLSDGSEGAVTGGAVGFFSLEMSADQLAMRILSTASDVASEKVRRGELTESEFQKFVEAARTIEECPLYIDDTPALSISQIANRARRLKRKYGLDLLVVDYLQLVNPNTLRESRVVEVGQITQGLKAIAKELSIPVLALSQLSRQVESREDRRPLLSDLRESGSIEQDADVVMFIFREEYYLERQKPPEHLLEKTAEWQNRMNDVDGIAEVIISKQRHGPVGTVKLSFEGNQTRFGNLADSSQADSYNNQTRDYFREDHFAD